jgi:hypothetical protein
MAFGRKMALILTSLILLTQYLSAQQKITDYNNRWKIVDSLINKKGLSQSALEEVNKIYILAKKDGQDAQVIKALVYQAGLQQMTEESNTRVFTQWQQEINISKQPAKAILQSTLAEQYRFYFQQHRYQLYDRTATIHFKKEDIATWGLNDFHEQITKLYLASLADEKLLQQTTLERFDPIIIKGNARNLRPTLFDLLAHRALAYFENDEKDITKASYAFELDDEKFFSPAGSFSTMVMRTSDSASLYHKALLIYQQLLSFHANDAVPDALIDADIQRLQFVYQHSIMAGKDSAYEKALMAITKKYPGISTAAQASYLVAQLHADRAAQYDPLKYSDTDKTSPKHEYLAAAAICKMVLQQTASSEGSTNCYNLLQQIEKKELNLNTEKVNLPDQPFRTLVNYRNFTNLYFRVALLTDELKKKLENRYDDNYWKELVALKPLRNWSQSLPVTNDYQKHSAEIKVDALPVGQYILLASANNDFSSDKNPLAVQYFYVSGISYINNSNEYFFLDRETGLPLAGAAVQTWWNQYDYTIRNNKRVKGEKQTADKNGYVRFAKNTANSQANLQLEITHGNDRLFMDDRQYVYYRTENTISHASTASQYEKDEARVFFFTDRSIYRPGQTLYFKGIAVTKDFESRKSKIYTGVLSKIFLRNANGEDIDSLELKTNEYGSYSGKFVLPQGVLNGEFTLIDEKIDGNTSFSVEEYKRPKFFVDYEKIKGVYKVNDSITVTGFAKAYAGNNIDGAQVKYRVQRVARFIYPWLYWKYGGYPRSSNMEITNGVVKTGADGKFTIKFKAIPDLSIAKDLEPVFDYQLTADITDLNGETRSAETMVPVSYKALQLKVSLPATLPADSLENISITTQNLNGEFEPAQVNVFLYGLKAPDRLIRKRYWQAPDQFTMSKDEFIKNFPYDEYQDEADYHSWSKDKIYLRKIDSTNSKGNFELPATKLPEGWYALEVSTKDKFGETIKDVAYIQLYDEKSQSVPTGAYTWSAQKDSEPEPGQQSIITIGTPAKDVFLIQEIDKTREPVYTPKKTDSIHSAVSYHFTTLNGKQSFSFPVTESDRGGFGVYHFFVKNNRLYSFDNRVNVPWTNKELTIGYETFRDKTLPGSEEKWKLKISGNKKEKIAAEMLLSMYDASLDQFKPHSWNVPGIWESYSGANEWNGNGCFVQVQSQEKYWNEQWKTFVKTYDYLNTMNSQEMRLGMIGGGAELPSAMYKRSIQKDVAFFAVPETNKISDRSDVVGMAHAIQVPDWRKDPDGSKGLMADTVLFERSKKESRPAETDNTPVQIRKNFNETAFFFPDLRTDSTGNISFGFTIPEALTKWKFQSLAHTKDLSFGYSSNSVITQKPLMVQPNAPRFLREGDKMEFSAKVVNLTDTELTGTVVLELINTATNQPVDGWFRNMYPTQYFTAEANQSTVVKFSIDVPYQYNSAVSYRFVARAGDNTDGEEAAMPVLSNSMLVTETMPLPMRGNAPRNFRFERLLQSGNSETLQQYALTVEFTTNPAWYAVQALPYLMEYPYECAEQTFNRYYANALASKIANTSPRLKEIFERWNAPRASAGRGTGADSAALLSNLQKNPELKAALLEETPWVMEAKNEAQQKKNIALLFDMMKMSRELSTAFEKLKQMQSENGGFAWFKGGADDRFITQYMLTGLGHLSKLQALNTVQSKDWSAITGSAIKYLDQRIKEDYEALVKNKMDLTKNHLGYVQVQFLYMRSFFSNYPIPGASFTAINYYRKQSQQYWLQENKYMQGMIALSLFRSGDLKTAGDILKSLKQNAIVNDEMGMYWKDNIAGYYWHQAPVETQSLLIEAFAEINKDNKTVEDLKTWLLKQKQTQNWKTTKATAEACYALLLQGNDWLNNTPNVEIRLGDKSVSSSLEGAREEVGAGTGYFKQIIDGPFVKPAMGEITVKIASTPVPAKPQPAWGAVYWQYFEQLDKITPSATPLKLDKKLFIEKNSDKGPVLEPLAENGYVKVGDKIKVRIELRVDRDMEYVHMKDMRASCMEPVNVLSEYKWQGGLGYYESTKDASTNFFFGWLPKGTYVFEYPLFVTHAGNFSNGITSIQCMYAPEFASHSEGIRLNAEENK